MKQPRINGRQARWLVYLTPYDFVIKHRPGILNPADGPSRWPDYKAQGEPGLVQKELLANELVGSKTDRPNPGLHDTARCYAIAQGELSPLTDSLCNTAKCQLCIAARSELAFAEARPESIFSLPEAERVTKEVNA